MRFKIPAYFHELICQTIHANLFFSITLNAYFEKWKKPESSQRLCKNKPANMMF